MIRFISLCLIATLPVALLAPALRHRTRRR